MNIVSWEPEGCYCSSKMFHWEPGGRYHHRLCTAIVAFWFSMEHLWIAIMPFWLSADNIYPKTNFCKCYCRELCSLKVKLCVFSWEHCFSVFPTRHVPKWSRTWRSRLRQSSAVWTARTSTQPWLNSASGSTELCTTTCNNSLTTQQVGNSLWLCNDYLHEVITVVLCIVENNSGDKASFWGKNKLLFLAQISNAPCSYSNIPSLVL